MKSESRHRFREYWPAPGVLPAGSLNAITDVPGLKVGHITLVEGQDVRTGATAILPHGGNLYQEKVPAGLAVGNGFGKKRLTATRWTVEEDTTAWCHAEFQEFVRMFDWVLHHFL